MQKIISENVLADRITFLCEINHISINKALEKCDVNKSVVDNIKKGSMPSVDKALKIANYFNVSVDYLLGRTDNPTTTFSISNNNTTVSGTQANVISSTEPIDEMTSELIKAFKQLEFSDKMEVMNFVLSKNCKKE